MTTTLVTGAAGFIGSALCRRLLARRAPATGLTLTDLSSSTLEALGGSGVALEPGSIEDRSLLDRMFARPVERVFHLAGVVSGAAEADFALGKRVNLDATIALLERCRLQVETGGPVPRFVYASSIAVFGVPLPARIDDATPPAPTLSYGAHKRACEILIDDYTRRGWIDGRALRLSGAVVRPALPNGALSGFNSDLIREPLAGRDYVCPLGPEATLWLCSLPLVIDNLLRIAEVDAAAIGARRALTAPALAVSIADLVAAIARVDPSAAARIAYEREPSAALRAQFGCWPLDCAFERARALGLQADVDADALLARCIEHDAARGGGALSGVRY